MKLSQTWLGMNSLLYIITGIDCFEEKLLYSTSSGKIKELNIINGEVRELGNAESEVFVLAYDNEEKYVYVPRQTQGQIIRFPYPSNQTTEFEIVVSEIIPGGIAFDSEHRYLYWTEPMEGKIMRCNTDGSNITRIFNDTVEPAALTIDKGHRWMYFGQGIPNGTIHKLSLDGEGHHIINDLASWVFGIYADDTRLYWMDNFMGDLKSTLFDGTDIQTIVSTNTFKLNGEIDVKEKFIFYTSSTQILKINTNGGEVPIVLHTDTERVHGLLLIKQEDSTNLCGENVDNFNTTWRLTEPNTLVVLPCTGEYTGNASRYCSSDGKWMEPSYINCISKSIQQLKEQTAQLLSGEGDYNLTIILKDLENITHDNDELRSGDLLTSSDVLNDIAKYVTVQSDKLEVDQLEIFGSLCDNLLDERNHRQWKELNDEGSGGVTPLVNAVTEYNNAFNEVIDSNYSLVVAKKNIVMQVGKASVDEITVPDRQKTSNSWIAESATEIKLKKNICNGQTGYSSTFYRNISSFFPEYLILNGEIKSFNGSYDVNSIVADFTIHGTPCSNYSLIIKFEHLLGKYTKPFCGHWNFSTPNTVNGAWSSNGSQVVDASDSYTICEYNHTTNFAILMSPGQTPSSHHGPLSYISAIGCGVSILFLVITILIHFVLWRYLGNDRTKTLMNLCVALILSYILFLAGITRTENKIVCTAIAVALHYIFLTDFALMLAEGIQIVRMVVIVFPTKSIVHKLIPACWIVPACIVGISAGVSKLKGYGNDQFCWLTLESNLIWAFIGPALLVIVINFVIITITVYKMMTSRGLAAKTLKVKSKIGLKSICVILPLFGVTWVLGAFSVNDDLVIFQYLFAIFNSLQGLFICVFHCFLNKQVRHGYQQYQRRRQANRMDSKHSSDFSNLDRPKSRLSITTIAGHKRNK